MMTIFSDVLIVFVCFCCSISLSYLGCLALVTSRGRRRGRRHLDAFAPEHNRQLKPHTPRKKMAMMAVGCRNASLPFFENFGAVFFLNLCQKKKCYFTKGMRTFVQRVRVNFSISPQNLPTFFQNWNQFNLLQNMYLFTLTFPCKPPWIFAIP